MRQLKTDQNIRMTNRKESYVLQKYLNDLTNIPRISPERECQLAQMIRNGNQKALDELVEANLRFVYDVAKQYQNLGLPLVDLINEGNYGLIKAAQRFDESKGFKFISYGVWWARQTILVALAEQTRVTHIPAPIVALYSKASQLSIRFEQENEREPSVEELAEMMKVSKKNIGLIMKSKNRHVEIDAPVSDDEPESRKTKGDMVLRSDEFADTEATKFSFRQELMKFLKRLPAEEADTLEAVFKLKGDESLTREQVAKKHGYKNLGTIQSLKTKGLTRLRKYTGITQLKVYLD